MAQVLSLELGTPDAERVQKAVQHVLVAHDLATADDTVMAEYITVMMANRKGPDMIGEELRELVGGELDASITNEIWAKACDALAPKEQPKASVAAAAAARKEGKRERSASPARRREHSPERRGHDQGGRLDRASERWGDARGRTKKSAESRSRLDKPATVSILGRAGIPDPRAEPFVPAKTSEPEQVPKPPQALEPQQAPMPFPHEMPPPLAAMAAMAAMAGAPSLFARLDPMMPENAPPMPGAGLTTEHAAMVPRDISAFPAAPSESALCRWSVQCTNPMCAYSHPSPANAGKGGDPSALVLRADACEQGAECKDKECVMSHVSPAVGFIKARGVVPMPSGMNPSLPAGVPCKFQQQCLNPACTYVHYDEHGRFVPPPGQTASHTPCRFGTACTRRDCMYMHPPRSGIACRYGDGCTRPNCFYTHPRDGPRRPTSDRLQAFANEDPDRERIVPDEQAQPGHAPVEIQSS